MKETSKSIMRRLHDARFATRYFVGEGIDIGAGTDPVSLYSELFPLMRKLRIWDVEHGDAQYLQGVPDENLDFVHSSHCLEHMVDPAIALQNWFRVLKPGGHLVVLVPDEDMYEQGVFPSNKNHDHKHTFTIFKTQTWSPVSVNLIELLKRLTPSPEIVKLELLDASYRRRLPPIDQTLTPVGECAIEFVLRKRLPEETTRGGRLPPSGTMTPLDFHYLTGL